MSNSGSHVSIAVVVPVYNEASTIEEACEAFVDVVRRYQGRAAVLAVDDGSSDGSSSILNTLAASCDVMNCEQHEINQGYGAALRTGAEWGLANDFDYVAFIDSDLTNPPEDLLKMGELASSGALYIKASRYETGGGMDGVPFHRRAFSRTGNLVGSWLFGLGVPDVTNGFRAARTELYCSWPLSEKGFAVIMEEVYWAAVEGVRIATFPTVLRSREESQRSSAFSYTPRVFREYLRYPVRAFVQRHSSCSHRKSFR